MKTCSCAGINFNLQSFEITGHLSKQNAPWQCLPSHFWLSTCPDINMWCSTFHKTGFLEGFLLEIGEFSPLQLSLYPA
jgi:hypothetical protein